MIHIRQSTRAEGSGLDDTNKHTKVLPSAAAVTKAQGTFSGESPRSQVRDAIARRHLAIAVLHSSGVRRRHSKLHMPHTAVEAHPATQAWNRSKDDIHFTQAENTRGSGRPDLRQRYENLPQNHGSKTASPFATHVRCLARNL